MSQWQVVSTQRGWSHLQAILRYHITSLEGRHVESKYMLHIYEHGSGHNC